MLIKALLTGFVMLIYDLDGLRGVEIRVEYLIRALKALKSLTSR